MTFFGFWDTLTLKHRFEISDTFFGQDSDPNMGLVKNRNLALKTQVFGRFSFLTQFFFYFGISNRLVQLLG